MRNESCYCKECFNFLKQKDRVAADVWRKLCVIGMFDEIIYIESDIEELCFLESLRFIVTTDHKNIIAMKLLGKKTEDNETFFCVNQCLRI